jgi:hypothetical protein
MVMGEMCVFLLFPCALDVLSKKHLTRHPHLLRSYKLFTVYKSLVRMADQWQNKLPEFARRLEEELYVCARSKARSAGID